MMPHHINILLIMVDGAEVVNLILTDEQATNQDAVTQVGVDWCLDRSQDGMVAASWPKDDLLALQFIAKGGAYVTAFASAYQATRH